MPTIQKNRLGAAAAMAFLTLPACGGSAPTSLGTQFRRSSFPVHEAKSMLAHQGDYQNVSIPLAGLNGDGLVIVRVGVAPLDDRPQSMVTPSTGASASLAQLTLKAQLILTNKQTLDVPVTMHDGILEAALPSVPKDASGLQYQVTSADPSLTYHVLAYTDVSLDTLTAGITINHSLQALTALIYEQMPDNHSLTANAQAALADLNTFGDQYVTASNTMHEAEKLAGAALGQSAGPKDPATQTVVQATQKTTDALAQLAVARQSLAMTLQTLPDFPGVESTRNALTEMVANMGARARIVGHQMFLLARTDEDLPAVELDVPSPVAGFDATANKISLVDGDQDQPSVVAHQYAHAVFFQKTGISPIPGPHGLAQSSSKQMAWNEGFATFFGQLMLGSSTYTDPSVMLTADVDANTVNGVAVTTHGSDVEANVQSALWNVFKGGVGGPPDAAGNGMALPFSALWQCLPAKPDTLDAFVTCLKKPLSPADATRLDRILVRSNIP